MSYTHRGRASIGIGTNLPFSEWGSVFPDHQLVAAIVDRVTFNAHILETGTQSYRLRSTDVERLVNGSASLVNGLVSGHARHDAGWA